MKKRNTPRLIISLVLILIMITSQAAYGYDEEEKHSENYSYSNDSEEGSNIYEIIGDDTDKDTDFDSETNIDRDIDSDENKDEENAIDENNDIDTDNNKNIEDENNVVNDNEDDDYEYIDDNSELTEEQDEENIDEFLIDSNALINTMTQAVLSPYGTDSRKLLETSIKEIEFYDDSGDLITLENGNVLSDIGLFDKIKIVVSLDLMKDANEGDYSVLKLPEGINFSADMNSFSTPFYSSEVDEDGKNYVIIYFEPDFDNNQIIINYGNYFNGNAIEYAYAQVYFDVEFDIEHIDNNRNNDFTLAFDDNGWSITVHLAANEPEIFINKEGSVFIADNDKNFTGNHVVKWDVIASVSGGRAFEPIIIDYIPAGLQLIDYDLSVYYKDKPLKSESDLWVYDGPDMKDKSQWEEEETVSVGFVYSGSQGYVLPDYKINIVLYTEIIDFNQFSASFVPAESLFKISNEVNFTAYSDEELDNEGMVYDESDSAVDVVINIMSKDGSQNVGTRPNVLTWRIYINEDESLKIPNAILEDTIPTGLTLDESSIKIYDFSKKGSVYTLGKEYVFDDIIESKSVSAVSGGTMMKLHFKNTLDKKYAIVYETEIIDPNFGNSNGTVSYENKAHLYSTGSGGYNWFKYETGKELAAQSVLLAKGGTWDKTDIHWTITVNLNKSEAFGKLSGFTVYDFIDNTDVALDKSSIQVYTDSAGNTKYQGDYTVYSEDNYDPISFQYGSESKNLRPDFAIVFENYAGTETLYIKYTTKITDMGMLINNGKNYQVHNYTLLDVSTLFSPVSSPKARASNIMSTTAGRAITVTGDMIRKSNDYYNLGLGEDGNPKVKFNHGEKTATWLIEVNNDNLDLSEYDIKIQDSFAPEDALDEGDTGKYMTFESIRIYNNNGVIINGSSDVSINLSLKNLEIVFKNLQEKVSIEITANVAQEAFLKSQKLEFKNTADFEAAHKVKASEIYELAASASFKLDSSIIQKYPMYIKGNAYIDWYVMFNLNGSENFDYSGMTVTDSLSDGLLLDTNSVVLTKYEVTNDFNAKDPDFRESILYNFVEKYTVGNGLVKGEHINYNYSENKFDFTFPDNLEVSYMYQLEYTSDIVTGYDEYMNSISFGDSDYGSSDAIVQANFASGGFADAKRRDSNIEFRLLKYDIDDSEILLEGAVFEIYDEFDNLLYTLETDENGELAVNLAKGIYKVIETEAPEGYYLGKETEWIINLSDDSNIFEDNTSGKTVLYHEIEIGNSSQPPVKPPVEPPVVPPSTRPPLEGDNNEKGIIKVIKLGENSEPLAGAVFTLSQDNNILFTSEPSDINGVVRFTDIPYGTYTLEEVQAPEGYLLTDETFRVKINSLIDTVQIIVYNMEIKGNLSILKIDGNSGAFLEGAIFRITDSDEDTVFEGATDYNGRIDISLPFGKYIIQEVYAPEGYELEDSEIEFEIHSMDRVIERVFKNYKKDSSVASTPPAIALPPAVTVPGQNGKPDLNNTESEKPYAGKDNTLTDDMLYNLDMEHHDIEDGYGTIDWFEFDMDSSSEGKTNPKTGSTNLTGNYTVYFLSTVMALSCIFLYKRKLEIR